MAILQLYTAEEMQHLNLTPEETQEFNNHFIGSVSEPLPPHRLAIRQAVAQKLYQWVMQSAPDYPGLREFADQYPMWRFWTCANSTTVGRVYGYTWLHTGAYAVKLYQPGGSAFAENITPPDSIKHVDTLLPMHTWTIRHFNEEAIFYDPCGFIYLLKN